MGNIIEIQGLTKSFGNKEILKGIDLFLKDGENMVILGKSGTGKSVLIKCIVGLIIPDSGTIRLFGDNLSAFDEETFNELRTKIGYLFQGGAIYDSMSVKENLEFPIKRTRPQTSVNELKDLVAEALINVGLEDAIDKMPSELSGGMRKRLGLARTLILKPKIIFYDEPTTGLDPVTSKEISELIVEIQEKHQTASIIITHDMKCARLTANRLIVLRNGSICKEGTYKDLKNSKDKEIRAYFN